MNKYNLSDALVKQIQAVEFDLNEFMMRPSDYDVTEFIGDVQLLMQSIMIDLELTPYTRYDVFNAQALIQEAWRRGIELTQDEADHIVSDPAQCEGTVEDTIDTFIRINEF